MKTKNRFTIIFEILSTISEKNIQKPVEIGDLTDLKTPMVSKYLKTLENEDYLSLFGKRSRNRENYSLTVKGKKLLDFFKNIKKLERVALKRRRGDRSER